MHAWAAYVSAATAADSASNIALVSAAAARANAVQAAASAEAIANANAAAAWMASAAGAWATYELTVAAAAHAFTVGHAGIWETYQQAVASANTGTAATSRRPVRSRLPASLPSTSWASSSRLTRSNSSVLRSFS
ncbi:MAG: hypothetical protein ACK53L_08880, partial [Pirellulaceae bacterium]